MKTLETDSKTKEILEVISKHGDNFQSFTTGPIRFRSFIPHEN